MKRTCSVLLALAITVRPRLLANAGQPIQVYFSPRGGCTDAVGNQLNHATNSILVQACSFTSAPIAKALVDARKRRLSVQVILAGHFLLLTLSTLTLPRRESA